MGNLHAGHLALMAEARQHARTLVASIFVNRLQFGPHEDFNRYPRTLEADAEQLAGAGVDILFAPMETELYPKAQTCLVELPDIQHQLEGSYRAGHFRGVATVVLKLFNLVQPRVAVFGKKDYQQLMLIREMCSQFNLPISLIGVDTVRAEDGLALSSRNQYLSSHQRAEAPRLYRVLNQLKTAIQQGRRDISALENEAMNTLDKAGWKTDYVAVRQSLDLLPPTRGNVEWVVLAASYLGTTRLIDNLEFLAPQHEH